jgi:hypothetical protein
MHCFGKFYGNSNTFFYLQNDASTIRPRYQPPPAQNVLQTSDSKVIRGSVQGYVLPSDPKVDPPVVGKKTQQLQGGQITAEPALKKAITEEPTLNKLIMEPTLKKVITEEPTLNKLNMEPTLKKVITEEPTSKTVITEEPTLKKVITEEPTLKKVITEEPNGVNKLSEDDMKNRAQNRHFVISETEKEEEVTSEVCVAF